MSEQSSILHFDSKTVINKSHEKQLSVLIQALFDKPQTFQFRSPVEWEKYGLVNYPKIIKKPMDLQTVRKNIKKGVYKNVQQCLDHIQLIWENSKIFNHGTSWIYNITLKCEAIYHKMIKNYFPGISFNQKKKILKKKGMEKQDQSETKPISQNLEFAKNHEEKETIMEDKQGEVATDLNLQVKERQVDTLRQKFLGRVIKCSYQQISVVYLMIKNNCLKAIKYDEQGNCCIDAEQLEQDLLNRIFQFLDNSKSSKTPKKKVKKTPNSVSNEIRQKDD